MRIITVILINLIFLGGLASYMSHRDAKAIVRDAPARTQTAQGIYTLEITPGFAPAPDPFALSTDKPALLLVKMGDRDILRTNEPIEAGKPLRVENLSGLSAGSNELRIQAGPPSEGNAHHALRVRILENENPIADATFWAQPGAGINDTLYFSIASRKKEAHHD